MANPELLASALAEIGNFWFDAQTYKEALDPYTKAIQLDPDDAITYNNRGWAYHELGQGSNAQQDWDKARSLGIE